MARVEENYFVLNSIVSSKSFNFFIKPVYCTLQPISTVLPILAPLNGCRLCTSHLGKYSIGTWKHEQIDLSCSSRQGGRRKEILKWRKGLDDYHMRFPVLKIYTSLNLENRRESRITHWAKYFYLCHTFVFSLHLCYSNERDLYLRTLKGNYRAISIYKNLLLPLLSWIRNFDP